MLSASASGFSDPPIADTQYRRGVGAIGPAAPSSWQVLLIIGEWRAGRPTVVRARRPGEGQNIVLNVFLGAI